MSNDPEPPSSTDPPYAVVIPTVGRPSLHRLLDGLEAASGPAPADVVVVDDRREATEPLLAGEHRWPHLTIRVLRGYGHGPAAARNLGWRVTSADWVAFLDDDVELRPTWRADLVADLRSCDRDVAASQGRLHVPLPVDRRPTDWERSTAGLEHARWATADMAYRRKALEELRGFDERFPRAYREDADLALRARKAGWRLQLGRRTTVHPVRAADGWVSVRVQRGNADDALMRAVHGRDWRELAGAGRGRLPWHIATALSAATAVAGLAATGLGHGKSVGRARPLTGVASALWLALTADFAVRRIKAGPADGAEIRRMVSTSVAIPLAAVWHRVRGEWIHRSAPAWPPPLRAVLFDRDGTLVEDVPYNGDPDLVEPAEGAAKALDELRNRGIRVGVITNQSALGRGLLSRAAVDAVNARIEKLLGPFDTWQVCPHAPSDGCECRKPKPGMVVAAARALGLQTRSCAVVGDIGSDGEAARAAGAHAVLVPTDKTLFDEIRDSPCVATGLFDAVALVLEGRS